MKKIGPSMSSVVVKKKSGCWERMLGAERSGYGRLMLGKKRFGAHRVAWILFNGSIRGDKFVCHHCDNPRCINPKHLFLGDQHDNILDCLMKNRLASAKLRPWHVRQIRRLISGGWGFREIGRKYGVSHRTISAVVHGTSWSHI